MHEASLAIGVLETIADQCRLAGYDSISAVRLRIGKAAGILPEALRFAFDIAKAGTIAADAVMEIELILLGGSCLDCSAEFESEERFIFACPACDSRNIVVTAGGEMQIVDIEVD